MYPVYSSETTNSGIIGYTEYPEFIHTEKEKYILFGDHTKTMNISFRSFSVCDNVKVLKILDEYVDLSYKELLFIFSAWQKVIPNLGYSRHWKVASELPFYLPTKNGKIDFDFMETFIAELEAERVAELSAYLTVSRLDNYKLSDEELKALRDYETLEW